MTANESARVEALALHEAMRLRAESQQLRSQVRKHIAESDKSREASNLLQYRIKNLLAK